MDQNELKELLDGERPGIALHFATKPILELGGVETVSGADRGRAAVLGASVGHRLRLARRGGPVKRSTLLPESHRIGRW